MHRKKLIVNYDLIGTDEQSEDYERLIRRLESHYSGLRIGYSFWFLRSPISSHDVFEDLNRLMDENDRLFVAELTGTTTFQNSECGDEALKEAIEAWSGFIGL